MTMDFLTNLVGAFSLIFAIIDPFASVPVYLSLTKGCSDEEKLSSADNAIIVAGIIALAFLFFGNSVLSAFGVSMSSFKIFGGLVLCLLALETVLGISFGKGISGKDVNVASVIIATPLLTGPGVMTTMVVLGAQFGLLTTLFATMFALLASWLIIRNSNLLAKAVGRNSLDVASKVMGLLLGAVGVEFIRLGLGA